MTSAFAATVIDGRGLLGQAEVHCCASIYCLSIDTVVTCLMSIYIVVGGGRRVYVILNILLLFLETVRLVCVLVS